MITHILQAADSINSLYSLSKSTQGASKYKPRTLGRVPKKRKQPSAHIQVNLAAHIKL